MAMRSLTYKSIFIDKVWGKEEIIANNEYCGKILHLRRGFRCSIHMHKLKDEVFYILEGKIFMEVNGDEYTMLPGEAIRILPNTYHRFTGLTDAKILEVSTHHRDEDSYRLTKSGRCNWWNKYIIDKFKKRKMNNHVT